MIDEFNDDGIFDHIEYALSIIFNPFRSGKTSSVVFEIGAQFTISIGSRSRNFEDISEFIESVKIATIKLRKKDKRKYDLMSQWYSTNDHTGSPVDELMKQFQIEKNSILDIIREEIIDRGHEVLPPNSLEAGDRLEIVGGSELQLKGKIVEFIREEYPGTGRIVCRYFIQESEILWFGTIDWVKII